MPPSSNGTIFGDGNTLQDKIKHADTMQYIVIALGCLVGVMIILFIVYKVWAYKKEKKEKERKKHKLAQNKQRRSLKDSIKNSPRRARVHPRIREIKKEEMVLNRSDSGYTSDSKKDNSPGTSCDNTPRVKRDSRENFKNQNEAHETISLHSLRKPPAKQWPSEKQKVDGLAF